MFGYPFFDSLAANETGTFAATLLTIISTLLITAGNNPISRLIFKLLHDKLV